MYKNDNNGNNNKGKKYSNTFLNEKQKKFFLISKAFKFGNVAIVAVVVIIIAKNFFGV